MVALSQAAAREIQRIQTLRQQPDSCFRLAIKTGGCSGLYYALDLEAERQEGDRLYESNGISIVVDEQSSSYLQEIQLDYSEDLMGGGFRFYNPQATASCSCGHSFTWED